MSTRKFKIMDKGIVNNIGVFNKEAIDDDTALEIVSIDDIPNNLKNV